MAQTLNREAKAAGIRVRQSYERVMHRLQIQHHRMRRSGWKKKAERVLHKMRKNVERLVRDLMRKGTAKDLSLMEMLMRAGRLLTRHAASKDKLYSVHASEVE